MTLPIRTTAAAAAQILELNDWWHENRASAPNLFEDELNGALQLIGESPHAGKVYRRSHIMGVRRLLLRRTGFHVYYLPRVEEVILLAVWHTRRGEGPKIRMST